MTGRAGRVHGPADLTWTEAAAALSTRRACRSRRSRSPTRSSAPRCATLALSDVGVEGIVGIAAGKREGVTPEQPRSVPTTTPSSLAGWAITHLRPAL